RFSGQAEHRRTNVVANDLAVCVFNFTVSRFTDHYQRQAKMVSELQRCEDPALYPHMLDFRKLAAVGPPFQYDARWRIRMKSVSRHSIAKPSPTNIERAFERDTKRNSSLALWAVVAVVSPASDIVFQLVAGSVPDWLLSARIAALAAVLVAAV